MYARSSRHCLACLTRACVLRSSRLLQYFGFLLIFDIILFAVGIAVYAENDSAEEYMSDGWCVATDKVVEALQEYFTCCGLYQFNDSISRIASDGTVIAAGCSIIRPSAVHYITCPSGLTQDNGQACLPILSSKFQSSYIAAGASAIAFAVVMAAGMIVVCILMSAIKQKKHLEEIRKLHRKLREAKEDPTHAALRARDEEEGSISAYDDVDLGAQEPIDTDVAINVGGAAGSSSVSGIVEGVEDEYNEDDTGASSYAGESTFTAQPPKKTKKSKKAAATKYREPEPEVEEQPYEDTYEEEQTGGYAHHVDEYDEEY